MTESNATTINDLLNELKYYHQLVTNNARLNAEEHGGQAINV